MSRGEEYSAGFGFLANALDPRSKGGDGDTGCSFPRSDAKDMSRGARFIPGEVTMARRGGQKVQFVTNCSYCCWYWQLPDGTRIYYWDRATYENIARKNGHKWKGEEFHGVAGTCPDCGNLHTRGGIVKP